ncbi:MAG: DUF3466 family protein [Planctomycetota bacterium]
MLFSCLSSIQAGVKYHAIDLGTLDGYERSEAYSINNKNEIVGRVANWSANSDYRAVLFDSSGFQNNIDLGTLGGNRSAASSININGQITGFAQTNNEVYSATIFDPNGTGNNISLHPDSDASENNDNNEVAGCVLEAIVNNAAITRAALFRPGDEPNMIDMGTLEGDNSSRALSINNDGSIVGISFFSEDNPWEEGRAVLFDSSGNGNNIDLGTLPGYDSAWASSINDKGQIVGEASNSEFYMGTVYSRAVLFDPSGGGNNINLGAPPGYGCAQARSINNKGQIVGYISGCSFPNPYHAVLFDRAGNIKILDELINPSLNFGLDIAVGINDNGCIICWGGNAEWESTSFLLIPIPAGPGDLEPDGAIDFVDFAIFASSWGSVPSAENWNAECDISEPKDNIIKKRDLDVLTMHWLAESGT